MTTWTEATRWTRDGATWRGTIDPNWAQGRAAFGGLVAVSALRAMAADVQRPLRSVLVSFVGPVGPGEAQATVEVLRAGRSLTHVEARVVQEGSVRAVVLGAFGESRPTLLARSGPPMPDVAPPDEVPPMPYFEGVTPTFTQHWEYRWTNGLLPFAGGDAHVQGWIRSRSSEGVDRLDVPALMDAWPAPVLVSAKTPAPASSATFQCNVLLDELPADPEHFFLYEARTVSAAGGYSDLSSWLWTRDGRLAATCRQLIAEFSGR